MTRLRCCFLSALIIVLVAACGGAGPTAAPTALPTAMPLPPTSTPLPPTDTPVPPTPTPAGPALTGELKDDALGFRMRYPDTWKSTPYPGMTGHVLYHQDELIDEVINGGKDPTKPVMLVLSGQPGEITSSDATDLHTMVEEMAKQTSSSPGFEQGELVDLTVGGQPAASVEVTWLDDSEVSFTARYIAVITGGRGYVFAPIALTEAWAEFVPVLDAVVDSVTFFKPAVIADLTQTHQGDGYSLRYPDGWEMQTKEGRVYWLREKTTMENDIPSFPAVMIETGPLAELNSGEMAGTRNAQQMVEAFAQGRRDEGYQVTVDKIAAVPISGERGAGSTVRWTVAGVEVVNMITTLHQGERGLIVHGYGRAADWDAFSPIYVAMVKSMTLTPLSITAEPTASGGVDFSDPASVVQAVFSAAQTQQFDVLAGLCDPQQENDEDTATICAITVTHAQKDSFVEYFAKGKLDGQPTISGDRATVAFLFGPNGDEKDVMTLIKRAGKWYLLEF